MRNNKQLVLVFIALLQMLMVCFASNTQAQALSEKLIAEDPEQLAQQARRDGDIVRGAILFHQGNINCAKCHRPTAEKERIGPDLSRMDAITSDQFIIDSILQPSKKIKEGYETFVVLTLDGQVMSGIKVSEDDNQIVIRDRENVDSLIAIARDDIDEIKPGKESSMPGDLVDQLKNRQQFLDLLRYVINVKERGPELMTDMGSFAAPRKLEAPYDGLVLIQKYNCVACHASDAMHPSLIAKQPPSLAWSAKSLNPQYIQDFIAGPHTAKPESTMPDLFGQLDQSAREQTVAAITHFLLSKNENGYQVANTEADATQRGFELFHSVGCVACHSPRNQLAEEQWLDESTPLGNVAQKYSIKSLTEFLKDPLAVRPSGHMPSMQLTHREALDVSNFLLQSARSTQAVWKVDQTLAAKGESLFKQYNCASCHTEFVASKQATGSKLKLNELNSMRGCLGDQLGNWPNFQLSAQDRESILTALQQHPIQLGKQQIIEVTLSALNCVSCHDRDGFGGVASQRNHHFQTTNLNLGDQGRIPPTLTGVGAKLNRKWMRDVMVNQRSIRPYMKTRMPQFGENNIGHLFELFESTDSVADIEYAKFDDQKTMREKGHVLAGNKGLNCVACHTFQYKPSDTMPAVDLTEMVQRLKKDWFYHYMLSPQSFSPNTVMPSFWPGGNAIRKDLEGTAHDQIEALWQYLIDGRQARAPRGVVRKPLEIVVDGEARILRRRYPEIGKRGIGVGYPGGVNIVFDAEQMRLGAVWKGKFAEASGVWRGQGSGNVRPMGRVIPFAKGPDLDLSESPWVADDGRPPDHQFKGYTLDAVSRPTFLYEFSKVSVADFCSQVMNENGESVRLRRSVTVASEEGTSGLRFRLGRSSKVKTINERIFSIEDQLQIEVVSEHNVRVINVGDARQIEVPLDIGPGETQELVVEYSWP